MGNSCFNPEFSVIFCTTILVFVTGALAVPCKTSNGYICVFPFIYQGKTYNKCTFEQLLPEGEGYQQPWCAYVTNANNSVMEKWDYCKEHCSLTTIPWWIVYLAIVIFFSVALVALLADHPEYITGFRKMLRC